MIKPIAWMETYKGEPNNLDWDKSNLNYGDEFHDVVPLYTHPAKTLTDDPLVNFKPVWQEKPELTLTNEEIEQIGKEYGIKSVYQFAYYEFAKAILRKAQEK